MLKAVVSTQTLTADENRRVAFYHHKATTSVTQGKVPLPFLSNKQLADEVFSVFGNPAKESRGKREASLFDVLFRQINGVH